MAESYRENYIYAGDDFSFYIAKVFCSWDYGITDAESATLKQKSISNDLKVYNYLFIIVFILESIHQPTIYSFLKPSICLSIYQ